ncbi:MAG: GH13_16 / GH13_36 / GH13_4 / GH13_17 / GH 13 / GH13_23 / GH13_31 / GH13_40 / GH13_29 / GH13 _30 / GH13_35 / GH13_20 / GH13_2 / GH13_34 / GH13 _21 / GH13_18 / GH13_19 / GH13_1 / GH13_10 [uncultured Acetobacteraceae bacterium]|uniref:Maltokinase n=1 Tax=uncultured Acetobacteraceae bacterium TaxID=169975 RepID=A0A6J4JY46_9PROT|nr:MAG: GH13_16 / GH13_36 / GH13_4 / GH13_17 / GH 13 / GH13_23 / GH13_31 / GH13_40 / GH13_29 / GH13 _30 / GH13_35 / GH13_20 / GH13_2 / GH13_34 / GH13 _21 / GH13_18 / GH13_19 / GH13_1 / GH13_10 [uncultured Acetobacteraceae bacterium]
MPRDRWTGQAPRAPEGAAAGVADARRLGTPALATTSDDPQWYRDAVIYQLHVKSFFDSNDDGVGDFAGLLQKLDYIAELGVDTLWLLPFYPSPRKDDGYDIADYRGVHPDYGTLQDARRFVREAHARGLRVVTELVINHTSDQHPWFQRARAARPGSSHHDYYVWSDTDQKYDGTRIIFLDTEKSNWTWDPVAKAYFWHRFYSHQPDLNFDNPRVMSEVLNAMRFWLDIGVDGLRLDAVPYLVERDGTNNENLSETHEVLKILRTKLDADYKGRMLLAEANQWPEDTQQYFGQGDECHMAFHFPLMPRMYMAIAQEDRFPITDILRQTPDIPEGCQWAVFLRNHDELTLEMVTDQERDYLWSTYAADRRARINLGIRRRLSPLLERDRRRIELMNGLLLSMPGTPVIYYGDEIGMGDNIFLGDRDGVRTPMQWSPDRNGGFSKADPARLVLPPIQDPLDGFQAVNVEAQARSPNSLLNWMRRMLAVRRRTRAFGRGEMNLLYPANRKVLAYLREHEDDIVLCVFNLSRAAQAVELDLSAHAGKVPFEMLGGTVFPPVGQLPYLLTLPPYGFYWFMLAGERAMPSWHIPSPEPLPDLRTMVMKMGVKELLAEEVRAELERGVLPEYLAKRRWFAAKGERLLGVRITGTAALPGANGAVVMTEVEAKLAGHSERYCLPLAGVEDKGDIGPLAAQLAVSRLRQGRRVGYLTDAFADDRMPDAVLAALRDGLTLPTDDGELRFLPGPDLAGIALPSPLAIRRLSAEQSNSSMILGDAVVLKIIRRINPGIHPEAEMTRHLTAAGYGNAAPLLGEVVRVSADGTPHTLMLAQGFVRNQGDAWGWTQDWLKRTIDEMALTDSDADADEPFAGYTSFAAAIGRRLGELHAALSRPSGDPAFAPETANDADRGGWAAGAMAQLDPALDLLRRAEGLSDADKETAEALLARADALRGAVSRLAESAAGALKTRVHGDFHLGQVLVAQGDAVIVDFEGEPARSLDERRAKGSPLRDVAGLLRSFDYAASVAAANESSATATAAPSDRRIALLQRWQAEATDAFRRAYRAAAAEAPDKWVPAEGEEALLDLFLIEKAAYEVRYEAANRPTWIGLPLRGLAALAARVAG